MRCGSAWRYSRDVQWRVGCVTFDTDCLSGTWWCLRTLMAVRLPWKSRAAQDDHSGASKKLIEARFTAVMREQWSLWCGTPQWQLLQVWNPRTTAERSQRFNGEWLQQFLWRQKRCWEWSNNNRDKTAKKRSEQWLWYHARNTKWMYCISRVIKYTRVSLYKSQSM